MSKAWQWEVLSGLQGQQKTSGRTEVSKNEEGDWGSDSGGLEYWVKY